MVVCKCKFLDGREVDITLDRDAKGSDLLESACKYASVYKRENFGVVYRGGDGNLTYNWWIEPSKKVRKQIPGKAKVWAFALVVKFYPKSIEEVKDEGSRSQILAQIQQDLMLGKTTCPTHTMAILASYWLQSNYGDWVSKDIDLQLADGFQYIQRGKENIASAKSDIDFAEQMMELHKMRKGMESSEADRLFVKLTSSLDHYGVHFYPAYEYSGENGNEKGAKVILGVGSQGIHRLKKSTRELIYTWKAIQSVSFKRDKVVLKLQGTIQRSPSNTSRSGRNPSSGPQTSKAYLFENMHQCKVFWRASISHHAYYYHNHDSVKVSRTIVGSIQAHPSLSSRRRSASSLPATPSSPRRKEHRDHPKRSSSSVGRLPGSPIPRSFKQRSKTSTSSTQTTNENNVFEPASTKILSETNVKTPLTNASSPMDDSPGLSLTPYEGTKVFTYPERGRKSAIKSNPHTTRARHGNKATSVTSTSGEEVLDRLSDVTDNTDMLCSPRIIEKAFSYAEPGGVNAISSWLEISPERPETLKQTVYKRPLTSRSPSNSRSRSKDRMLSKTDNKYNFERGRKSERHHSSPIVISANQLKSRDNSRELVKKERGRSGQWLPETKHVTTPRTARVETRNLNEIYDREFNRNVEEPQFSRHVSYRDRSPHIITSRTQRSPAIRRQPRVSHEYRDRVEKEQRANRSSLIRDDIPSDVELTNYELAAKLKRKAARERREIASWAYGDWGYDYVLARDLELARAYDDMVYGRIYSDFPEIPSFVKSVR